MGLLRGPKHAREAYRHFGLGPHTNKKPYVLSKDASSRRPVDAERAEASRPTKRRQVLASVAYILGWSKTLSCSAACARRLSLQCMVYACRSAPALPLYGRASSSWQPHYFLLPTRSLAPV